MKLIDLQEPFATLWAGKDPFEQVRRLQGQEYRAIANRRTLRIVHGDKGYFVKMHRGAGWAEIIKNLLMLKRPIVSARNEYRAIQQLNMIDIPTMRIVGFGLRGRNPARLESFLMTEELTGMISLEHVCREWPNTPPPWHLKKTLIETLACTVRALHTHGINHRDCYLCHFLLDPSVDMPSGRLKLHVIDLHRAQIRRRTPRRWIVKDVAGVWFSAMDIGLTRQDRLRFMRAYAQPPLREILARQSGFWRRVDRVAHRQYRREFGTGPTP